MCLPDRCPINWWFRDQNKKLAIMLCGVSCFIQVCSLMEDIEPFCRVQKVSSGFFARESAILISNSVSESKDCLNIEQEATKTHTKWLDSRQKFALNLNNSTMNQTNLWLITNQGFEHGKIRKNTSHAFCRLKKTRSD